MNKSLEKELLKLDNSEFLELRKSLGVATMIRNLGKEHGVSNKQIAERLKVQEPEVVKMLNGCYPFNLKIISVIEAYDDELYDEDQKEVK